MLAAALVALGFGVQGLSARVRHGVPPDVVTPRSHRLMKVETPDGLAFADVGAWEAAGCRVARSVSAVNPLAG